MSTVPHSVSLVSRVSKKDISMAFPTINRHLGVLIPYPVANLFSFFLQIRIALLLLLSSERGLGGLLAICSAIHTAYASDDGPHLGL